MIQVSQGGGKAEKNLSGMLLFPMSSSRRDICREETSHGYSFTRYAPSYCVLTASIGSDLIARAAAGTRMTFLSPLLKRKSRMP